MTKILLSLLMIGVVTATSIGATRAYYTAQGSSDGNTAASGTLTLTPGLHDVPMATVTGLAPAVWKYSTIDPFANGTFTTTPLLHIQNTGTIDFKYKFAGVLTGGSYSTGYWDKIWVQAYHYDGGTDTYVRKYEGLLSAMDLGSATSGVGFLTAGSHHYWRFDFALASDTGNLYQGDSATFKIVVDATQTTNPGWTQ